MLAAAELVCAQEQIDAAIERIAAEVTERLENSYPLLLTVMNGGLFFAGQLLPRLRFPLQCGYAHATRYAGEANAGELRWIAPPPDVAGRTVLVLDDVLDHGFTMAAVRRRLMAEGALACLVAVLVDKQTRVARPLRADFTGVAAPDRFLFGCGMDAHGVWRNLPEIYAVRGT